MHTRPVVAHPPSSTPRLALVASLVLTSLALVGGVSCRSEPKVKPGLGVAVALTTTDEATDTGERARAGRRARRALEPAGRVTRVTLAFDRPMVKAEAVGRDLPRLPFTLDPRVEGSARWLDARTLAFVPKTPLPRSTRFSLEVPAGTVAEDGVGLAAPFTHGFETERLAVRVELPGEEGRGEPLRWALPDQQVVLRFNQPVRPGDVAQRCAYGAPGRTVRGRVVATDAEADAAGEAEIRLRVAPEAPLPLATSWRFACDEALSGAEGPLPMAPAQLDAGDPRGRRAALARSVEFATYGPLAVERVTPAGRDVDPDAGSIQLHVSTPLRAGDDPLPIRIEPPLEGFPERASVYANQVSFHVPTLPPNTTYRIVVGAGLTDVFGQRLGKPFSATFRTGNARPRFDVETGSWAVEAARGSFPLWARNLRALDVEAAAISEARLPALLDGVDWWDDVGVDLAALKIKSVRQRLDVEGETNRWTQVALDPKALLGAAARGTGLYYFALSSPDVPREPQEKPDARPRVREVLVNLTNLGVTTKLAAAAGLVWVTRLDDGQPVDGAEVVVRDRTGKVRFRGRTGPDGAAETPGLAALVPPAPPPVEGDGEGEGEPGEDPRRRLLVFVRAGEDLTFVDPQAGGSFEGWAFNVPVESSPRAEALRGFAHTDRGLYRPGDTVHVRGLVRLLRLGQGLAPPAKRKVRVEVRDPRGDRVVSETLPLSRYGSFSLDARLPADARLGDYAVEAHLPEGSFRDAFSVEEYRAATMEAKIAVPAAPEGFVSGGTKLRLVAEGRYLYGAPVRAGTLKWRVHSRAREVRFAEHEGFDFGDARTQDEDAHGFGAEAFVTEQEGTLDPQGKGAMALTVPKAKRPTPHELVVSAEVKDETNQTVAANLVVPVHPARVYVGLRAASPVLTAGRPAALDVVAVDPAGKRVGAPVAVTIRRRVWNCAWESWGYRGSYRCEKKETEVARRDLVVPADRPEPLPFTPPEGGEYWIVAEGRDEAGRTGAASQVLWATGPGEAPWRVDESSRFDVVADKRRYRPGDTARLLLKTPVASPSALVTIEREGILERKLMPIEAGQALEIPIKESHGPNVFVSVMIVRGRTGKGVRGLPQVQMGLAALEIDTSAKRLAVEVKADRASYRPGDDVTATIRVRDAQGAPVQAEVALSAADEGVLSLVGFRTPDPLATFHAPWGLGVRTASGYERLARLPEPDQDRYATGGDGAGRLGTLRARFLATAYWNPRLETDAAGEARVTFKAPDNLTAYRLMAVAADAQDRFGSGDARVQIAKPLQLLSALPRFLSVGDAAQAGVLLVNDTGKPGRASVQVTVAGARLEGPAEQSVELAAGARATVRFPVRAEATGAARFRFRASLGAERDGLEQTIPVQVPTRAEAALVASGETKGAAQIPIALPAGVVPGTATLELSVDPDGLAGIEEGLRDLIEYPYGCLEQTTSRLIPLVAVEELARSLGLADLDGPKLQTFIRAAVEKIGRFQHEDGGFGLWLGSRPEPYLTAFALWGWKLAAEAGHAVDKRRMDAAVAYLRRSLGAEPPKDSVHNELGELGSRAFILYVLARMGSPDPGGAERLLEQKDKLPRFGRAFLARALAGPLGADDARVKALLDELVAAAEKKPTLALIREPGGDALDFYMSSDARTTAIATDAFLDLRPQEPTIPALVRGLLAAREGGAWRTTQENLYALVALTHYLKVKPPTPLAARVTLGEAVLLDGGLEKGAPRLRHASLALPAGAVPPLRVEAREGTAHYSVRLRYRRDPAHVTPVEAGFSIQRTIVDPETGAPLAEAVAGKMVRVRVAISAPAARHHVAVSAPVPAGLELVNSRFATTAAARPAASAPGDAAWHGRGDHWITQRELRDDRVDVFADYLWPGTHSFEYLARATTPGRFVAPAATVLEMYKPEVRAQTGMDALVVTGR